MNLDKFIIDKDNSMLLIVDMQDRLLAAMDPEVKSTLEKNILILINTMQVFGIPVVVSEQYRKGLGPTALPILAKINQAQVLEKLHFDCMKDDALLARIKATGKKNVIVTGIESHVCVFQTAISLMQAGLNAIVVSDAVASRRTHDWRTALAALASAGAVIYPTETVSFFILEKAGTPEFKSIAPLFK